MASASSSKGKEAAHEHVHVPEYHNGSEDEIQWPVVRAEDVEDAMEHRVHFLDDTKGRTQACLSEMAGMFDSGMGIHKVELAPHTESTVVHTHVSESEWIYILEGTATLLLVRQVGDVEELRPAPLSQIHQEETLLKPGDFAGFPAGNPKERYAHALRAGDTKCTYLLGGDRKNIDVISYPTLGKTLVSHEESGAEAMFTGRSEQ